MKKYMKINSQLLFFPNSYKENLYVKKLRITFSESLQKLPPEATQFGWKCEYKTFYILYFLQKKNSHFKIFNGTVSQVEGTILFYLPKLF